MKQLFFLIAIVLLFFSHSKAQELTVGDNIPDLKSQRYFKDGRYTDIDIEINSPQHNDKLFIFDFWSPGCAPCIAGFPKMDSLQKHFGDQIMILPIVSGPKKIIDDKNAAHSLEKIIADFWRKNPFAKRATSLGTLVENYENKCLYKYFPNSQLPSAVWVKGGKVIAMTGPEYVNVTEIRSVLAGESKSWATAVGSPNSSTVKYDFDIPLPAFMSRNKNTSLLEESVYSFLGRYIPGKLEMGPKHNFEDTTRKVNKITYINGSLYDLYRVAFQFSADSSSAMRDENRWILEVSDLGKIKMPDNIYSEEWRKLHCYSYELSLPSKYSRKETFTYMVQDLNKYFRIKGRIEKRNIKCWIISKNASKVGYEPGLTKKILEQRKAIIKKIGNPTEILERQARDKNRGWQEWIVNDIEQLTKSLAPYSKELPVLDESGFKGHIEFLFRSGPKVSFEEYRKQLEKNGFSLTMEDRLLDMIVLTEKEYKGNAK